LRRLENEIRKRIESRSGGKTMKAFINALFFAIGVGLAFVGIMNISIGFVEVEIYQMLFGLLFTFLGLFSIFYSINKSNDSLVRKGVVE